MMFVRYKGASAEFIEGKVYIAKPEMDGSAGMLGFFDVRDENGNQVREGVESGRFEFLEEVYAVVVKPFNGFKAGEVVVVSDASEDGKLLKVEGEGFCAADGMEILDRTNVRPGVVICDAFGKWQKVVRVNEILWVMVEGGKDMWSPEGFTFPVSYKGDLMVDPLVECIMSDGQFLTEGKRYYLIETRDDGMVVVKNDKGDIVEYIPERFRMG